MEDGGCHGFSSPSPLYGGGGDGGKELLRHLLKDKASPATTPSPTGHAPPTARRQLSNESVRSEEEDRPGSHGNMVRRGVNFESEITFVNKFCTFHHRNIKLVQHTGSQLRAS